MIRRRAFHVLTLLFATAACGDDSAEPLPADPTAVSSAASGGGGESASSTTSGTPGAGGSGGAVDCGDDTDNFDGSCTRVIQASPAPADSGFIMTWTTTCPFGALVAGPVVDWEELDAWPVAAVIEAPAAKGGEGPEKTRSRSHLSFDTSSLDGAGTVVSATLRVHDHVYEEAELVDGVVVTGGDQPVFGDELTSADDAADLVPLDSETPSDIKAQTYAEFDLPAEQINTGGKSQFVLALRRTCGEYDSPTNVWFHYRPSAADASKRPALSVIYQP
jgi:hypothetical protein